jgi:hypothetical protein
MSLWIYAYSQGVSSGREVSRLCEYDPAYQWLTGMEGVNYHTLCDFRVKHDEGLQEVFAQVLGILSMEGLVTLERVMQDGTRVKANASTKSFRREERIRAHLELAREQVRRMGDPRAEEASLRAGKARERAARERKERLEEALKELKEIQTGKSGEDRGQARVSMTDPQARVMKQGNGGWGPSYNIQVMSDAKEGVIVGVAVTQSGTDSGELSNGIDVVRRNLGRNPNQVVADGGYTSRANIVAMSEQGIDFVAPVPEGEESSRSRSKALGITPDFYGEKFVYNVEEDNYRCPAGKRLRLVQKERLAGRTNFRYEADKAECRTCGFKQQCCPKSKEGRRITRGVDDAVVEAFYRKMDTDEAKEIYKQRARFAEFPNAWIKEKIGLRQFRLRGKVKAGMEALWACLTYNIQQWIRLCWLPQLAVGGVR